ncbi:MAG TPA: quinol:electron acceptor oxidoreductase subunit ActD [Kofleriaceae bacterium]|nr:quinol:electron acceptor oxidoreductase subunit ActD [Kofleriaceae bacterium]
MREPLIAVFADPDAASRALAALHAEGVTTARIASPAPYPAVHQTGHPGPWRVLGWVALVGGLTGLSCALALQVMTSRALGQIVGGKPVISWTAFGVVMFELTMLFAGASTLIALVVLAAFTRRHLARRARAAVASDRIVVVVPLDGKDGEASEASERRAAITRSLSGAVEVLS